MASLNDCEKCMHYSACYFWWKHTALGNHFLFFIEDCPNFKNKADVVEVVRCKDCKHWGGITYGQMCRKYSGAETKVCTEIDHYCSYGERRETDVEK